MYYLILVQLLLLKYHVGALSVLPLRNTVVSTKTLTYVHLYLETYFTPLIIIEKRNTREQTNQILLK